LDNHLNRHDLRQFKQRIGLRLYIDPLNAAEVQQYIRFRWAKAGGHDSPPFTPDAINGVVQWSQGIPRLINSICDSALLMAYGDESPLVGLNYVRAAAVNLALANPATEPLALTAAVAYGEKHIAPIKLTPVELPVQPPHPSLVKTTLAPEPSLASLDAYSDPKTNSSLLRRLAEKFGIPY
jgi:hypothetical protein